MKLFILFNSFKFISEYLSDEIYKKQQVDSFYKKYEFLKSDEYEIFTKINNTIHFVKKFDLYAKNTVFFDTNIKGTLTL